MRLVKWVVGRQHVGHPASCEEIIYKAGTISALASGQSWEVAGTGASWTVTKTRNSVTSDDTRQLFNTLLKVVIEIKMDGACVFNMDETAFQTSNGARWFIAVRGSKNVWHQDLAVNFHLTVVACGSAAAIMVPPLFILPGVTVRLDDLDRCEIPGAAVTTTSSGFMNCAVIVEWLEYFSRSVPVEVKRPLPLVLDDYSSHYSIESAGTAG